MPREKNSKTQSNDSGLNLEAQLFRTDLHPELKAGFILANPPPTSVLLIRKSFTVCSDRICS